MNNSLQRGQQRMAVEQNNSIQSFMANPAPELKTFVSLLDYVSSIHDYPRYFYKSQQIANIPSLLKILAQRATLTESIQLIMELEHKDAIHLLASSQNQQDQELLISYLGLYPSIEPPIGTEVPSLIPNIQGYSGNPFWVTSQNILYDKVHSDYFTNLKKTDPNSALILAILIGDEVEIFETLRQLQFEWNNIIWAKLYVYCHQQLLSRIVEIEKQNFREPEENLKSLQTQYSLEYFDWNEIESQIIQKNTLDAINLRIIQSIVETDRVDVDFIFAKIRDLGNSNRNAYEIAMKSGVYLYSKYPSQKLKDNLLGFVRNSHMQEEVLPLVFSNNEDIADFYMATQKEGEDHQRRLEKFKAPAIRSMIAEKCLNSSDPDNKTLSTVRHIIDPSSKARHILELLPNLTYVELQSALEMLRTLLESRSLLSDPNVRSYSTIHKSYSNIVRHISPEHSQGNFNSLYNFLTDPPSGQILNIQPPQANKHLLMKAITHFYNNAVSLIDTQNYHKKSEIFEKSKEVTIHIEGYIHSVLNQQEIIKTLHRGVYEVLIRDPSLLNDMMVGGM